MVDIKKLEKAIDGMDTICAKGKKDVKRVFEAALGVEFESESGIDVAIGQIRKENGRIFIVSCGVNGNALNNSLVELNNGTMYHTGDPDWKTFNNIIKNRYKLVANSLKEYLDNGGKI